MAPDPAPGPAIFVMELQDGKKIHFFYVFSLLFEDTFTSFFKERVTKQ
jgi:hypothetical protein